MQPYFIWKNENSLDNFIIINKLPDIFKPARRVKKIDVPGRNGFLTESDETYEGVVKACECILTENSNIERICNWLTGTDEVVFSNEPDKIYNAAIINQIPFQRVFANLKKFIIQFDCQPFKKAFENTIIINSPIPIFNLGTIASQPKCVIYGTGTVVVAVNGRSFTLNSITEPVTVDSELQDCYTASQLFNNHMIGDFPVFDIGENEISWTGTIEKIEITPNWRWL